MQERWLGTLGPRVSSVGLGCMNLAGAYGSTSAEESIRLLDKALELGINFFDTADIYGMGLSEETVGPFLRERRARVVIASKGGIRFRRATGERYIDNSPAYIQQAVDNSLRRLQCERIDLYYLHRRETDRPIEEAIGTLANLKRAGKIGAIGLSEVTAATLRRAHQVDRIAAVQSEYSLWTRLPERELLATTAELGVAFVAFSPLARGMLTAAPPTPDNMTGRDFRFRNPRFAPENYERNLAAIKPFRDFAAERGIDPATLALSWILSRARNIVAIPGTRSADHLEAFIKGASVSLSSAEQDAVLQLFPEGFPWGDRYGQVQRLGIEQID